MHGAEETIPELYLVSGPQEMLPELTMLAQNVVNVDRYRFESLCAIGEACGFTSTSSCLSVDHSEVVVVYNVYWTSAS